ncbi:MAG: hypothetical protein DLM56_10305 [Pseudonocardiales bacterium]|nr:MAG: hypothetical protein DLM56_10305 [Pseudonocardiales bacterium]
MITALEQARVVADAVLYEGYLLYPYRASSSKNRVRWQFGILGPASAPAGIGEPPEMRAECLLAGEGGITVHVRFLQLQARQVQDAAGQPVQELRVDATSWLCWEEAVPREVTLGPLSAEELRAGQRLPIDVPGSEDVEVVRDSVGTVAGALRRSCRPLRAEVDISATEDGPVLRLRVVLRNVTEGPAQDRDAAIARSFLGAHAILEADGTPFVSLLEPPPEAAAPAARCENVRCWPVLASTDDELLLVSPIILYDHPEIAPESAGALFDSTEIDEILTLRVMTLTEEEKAEARATDPHAAAIIDRCDAMSPDDMQRLHGVLRNPHALSSPAMTEDWMSEDWEVPSWSDTGGKPWWDPSVDGAVSPETDAVVIAGVPVSRGSRVRVRPRRRADAQDLFFSGQEAKVAAVYADVDGGDHVAVVLTDDPAAELHEWYGRYLYFAPDELEPLSEVSEPGEEV